jgi:hypothetical protein
MLHITVAVWENEARLSERRLLLRTIEAFAGHRDSETRSE